MRKLKLHDFFPLVINKRKCYIAFVPSYNVRKIKLHGKIINLEHFFMI